eukprot:CAMPEP_0174992146 /NCGR_PEP_ID=MMETSP0004_2-20121128/22348_1 /TAXON_ID=420556 /ORGANISM="Ochromonas sp., Strain CCMP1393" /LENGTH=172 /DNA_ID=CAMNT_0016246099 /DNA_START=242 /DNA_END=760 /DNA_ORIENTATION=+
MIRQRMSTTEARITAIERQMRTHEDKVELVTQKVHTALQTANALKTAHHTDTPSPKKEVAPATVSDERAEVLTAQISFVNDRVTEVVQQIDGLNRGQSFLASKALIMENNVCVLAHNDACPPNMKKVGTFGLIEHNPENLIPVGFVRGEAFNNNGWNWLHGGLCCGDAAVAQ